MSRIIVKNIPKYIDEKRLRTIFSAHGDITDVKIIHNNGKSRRFCFIGYKNENAGKKAQEYLNNTFIDTSKITVDIAKTVDDPELPRAWSKHSKGSSRFNQKYGITPEEKTKSINKEENKPESVDKAKEEKKKKFLEFIELMKGNKQSWNDDARKFDGDIIDQNQKKANEKKQKKKGQNSNGNNQHAEFNGNYHVDDVDNNNDRDGKDTNGNPSSTSNKITINNNQENNGIKDGLANKNSFTLPVDEKRLFVLNIPFNITPEEVETLFKKYGVISELKMPKDKDGKYKGFCYITYQNEDSAIMAFSELDNRVAFGRILHIKPAFAPSKTLYQKDLDKKVNESNDITELSSSKEKSSFKKKKKIEMLKRLNDDTNWNTLFLNPNTIINEMAQRYNMKKSDILGGEIENQAVKVALAETQIIQETKEWLSENNLNIDVFLKDRKTCQRSNTIIMVKNIPYNISNDQLHELFSRYGVVHKTLLAPNRSLGIIEFLDPEHAKNAFKSLSYYEFKREPLYLEWAPYGLVDENEVNSTNKQAEENSIETIGGIPNTKAIFVKNLNFNTTEDKLKEVFEKENLGKCIVKIIKKKGLSCGYGFVEFELAESAQKAIKTLQNTILDEHVLKLSLSSRTKEQSQETRTNKRKRNIEEIEASNKIIIRNLAFETTKKELRDLIKNFGEVKSLRIPKKMNNQHRGFAFVEFTSVEEAKNAFTALTGTHMYGRRLNLEWAKSDRTLDELAKKVKSNQHRDCRSLICKTAYIWYGEVYLY